ncbi:adaptin protein [Halogeometricum pallidum JCM 14848]|uniref:Adaptin protein n=1 Tax=Halogeometricum pallidum JCM 14848 TaxID=1227487 RepID=M0D6X1_HALPD|nr:adaptin protein [Halogeometricum pallidum JCM 14848]
MASSIRGYTVSRNPPDGDDAGLETVDDSAENRTPNRTADEGRATRFDDRDEAVDPTAFVDGVVETALSDPVSAGDTVGDLLVIVRDCGDEARRAAGEALDLLGLLRPVEFEVWADDIAACAAADAESLSFVGMRALAQLAAVHPAAARKGLDAAVRRLETPHVPTRRAALAVVGEVGEAFPEAVARTDRQVTAAMRDGDATVRLAGVMAAGKLLGAEPRRFPRTVTALPEALSDDDGDVWTYAHVSLVHFAREHPSQVPERRRVVERLADVSDAELGVREGSTKDALTGLLAYEPGFDL